MNLEKHETMIIGLILASISIMALFSKIDASTYTALMGTFMGYAMGRIFNGYQNKE